MVDNDQLSGFGSDGSQEQWQLDQNQGWIESLTELVLEAELANGKSEEDVMRIYEEFMERALNICKLLHDLESELDGQVAFNRSLFAHHEALSASMNSWHRGSGDSLDELCFAMFQFISLLSQRINFGERD